MLRIPDICAPDYNDEEVEGIQGSLQSPPEVEISVMPEVGASPVPGIQEYNEDETPVITLSSTSLDSNQPITPGGPSISFQSSDDLNIGSSKYDQPRNIQLTLPISHQLGQQHGTGSGVSGLLQVPGGGVFQPRRRHSWICR